MSMNNKPADRRFPVPRRMIVTNPIVDGAVYANNFIGRRKAPFDRRMTDGHRPAVAVDYAFAKTAEKESMVHCESPKGPSLETVQMLDYFAARAPAKIPNWFIHTEPAKGFGKNPVSELSEGDFRRYQKWDRISTDLRDLDEDLHAIANRIAEHQIAVREWDALNEANRFYQWRWEYAMAMLKTRPTEQVGGIAKNTEAP